MQLITNVLFLVIIQLVENQIYLMNTEDGISIEFYDCISIKTLFYCRRPEKPIDLIRDNDTISCEKNGGKLYSFSELKLMKINTSIILHQWKSSLERVEQYSRYLRYSDQFNGYVCHCIHSESFGKNCEYRLPIDTKIDQTLQWQFKMKSKYDVLVQTLGDILCYISYECNFGQLCIDWREICDGIQHCMYGNDEKNCDILELNECENDEYRCMNGMCIPDQYFLDGDFDCLDWSDEIQFKNDRECTFQLVNAQCDDRICPSYQYSCGDGQCLEDRFDFQKRRGALECLSRREQYFICETHFSFSRWTIPNGRCVGGERYEEPPKKNRSEYEMCQYLLKCALSQGKEKGCPCLRNLQCFDHLNQNCSLDLIEYPSSGIVAPYLRFFFNRTHSKEHSLPDWIMINGTVNCRGILISITTMMKFNSTLNVRRIIEEIFCQKSENISLLENINVVDQCYDPNNSITICNESNHCLSLFRVKDGFVDCLNEMDELVSINTSKTCSNVQHYRFRCSINQPTCLSVKALGNGKNDCENRFDEFWLSTDRKLSEMKCNQEKKEECSILREYIKQSWISMNKNETQTEFRIPFRSYCDTFSNLISKEDENVNECQKWWICNDDQYQCQTGQCIEKNWLSDGEWDCVNAEDEYNLFYQRIKLLEDNSYNSSSIVQSRFGICNLKQPFFCFSFDTLHKPYSCLNLSQIANNEIDCLGAIDERNTLKHCDHSSTLGYNFKCSSSNICIPYFIHCKSSYRCPNETDDEHWCSRQYQPDNCFNVLDFICFDGKCIKGGRCNEELECSFGEDEYMCDYQSLSRLILVPYRQGKQNYAKNKKHIIRLPQYPININTTQIYFNSNITDIPLTDFSLNAASLIPAYWCNRGVGILLLNTSTVCFCPPQYYGDKCQYHSDRLIVLLHLNFSQSIYTIKTNQIILLKFLLVFLFDNETLMTNEFDIEPTLEMKIIQKKMIYFVYSHSSNFVKQRNKRYFNRSDILNVHRYSIRIEMYEIRPNEKPLFKSVWEYSIHFDYLPVLRLAKVLQLTKPKRCSNDQCNENEECHQLINDGSKSSCLCKNNFNGENCSIEDSQCKNNYCSSNSLCKPNYRSLLRGNAFPYCICPFNRYGQRCHIEHDYCKLDECLNGGTCLPSSTPNKIICLCPDHFYGSYCQWKTSFSNISLHTNLNYEGIVIQYFHINFISLDLILVHQQIHKNLPSFIEYQDDQITTPTIVLAKLYSSYHQDIEPNLYLLSLQINVSSIIGIVSINEQNQCLNIESLGTDFSPIQYHYICINNESLLCFYDNYYLCICNKNHTGVECFHYYHQLDQCSYCLAEGRCLKGDSNHFLCLCPSCYSGHQCEFNSKSFTFTLDQLFYTDLISIHKQKTFYLIIIIFLLVFLIGIPNNVFSFVTFKREMCLRTGIGHYLLYVSLVNQLNLGFLLGRLIHLSLIIFIPQPFSIINNIFCKLFNYFLICSTRISYWFSSFVALERVFTTIFINVQWFKKSHIARRLMFFTFILILISSSYELIFIKFFIRIENNVSTMCVMDFSSSYQSTWILIHQIISILHFILPILINLLSTIAIIFIVIKNKMNIHMANRYQITTNVKQSTMINNSKTEDHKIVERRDRLNLLRDVLNEHKEMITRPILTLIPSIFSLFSFPFFIVSFSLGCQTLETNQLRYLLMSSYFISFIPQIVTFFLYIYPSTFYTKQWKTTIIARRITTFRQ
ncbi:unnamed protein product [Rotaria magnacalcarata]|uniref:Uncharacterized protein n=1 Tax=Rotaria magnacalcarata TaxID=392030 RepID=A0A819TTN1_9BILA|nr:unnamed protein product [Rotaria magnacalcarata]CAF4084775.1 unnamed protein product [Rotaria magnacalcarata]